jgi:hypothetical protein
LAVVEKEESEVVIDMGAFVIRNRVGSDRQIEEVRSGQIG